MSVSRRKWSSVERLDDKLDDKLLGADLHNSTSNLQSLRNLSVSTPSLHTPTPTQFEEEEDDGGNHNNYNGRKGHYTSDSSGDEETREFNLHTPLVPTKSIGRQKKFTRHFKKDDLLIDYYACALAVDILLQGFLYITENHFAFYSNVFGRVSKVLIPVCTITKITKNKTALIFPNAIRVYTWTEKHVFASLISRDTTFALMHKVWSLWLSKSHKALRKSLSKSKGKNNQGLLVDIPEKYADIQYRNQKLIDVFPESENFPEISPATFNSAGQNTTGLVRHLNYSTKSGQVSPSVQIFEADEYIDQPVKVEHLNSTPKHVPLNTPVSSQNGKFSWKVPSHKLHKIVIFISVISIIVLVISAVNLYIRIDEVMKDIQKQMSLHENKNLEITDNEQLLKWQKLVHGNSANEIVQHIDENIDKIHKAYASLEACYAEVTQKLEVQNSDGEIRVDYTNQLFK